MPVVAARPVASLLLMLGVMIASGSACSSTAACKDLRPINATVREGQLSASQASCLTARLADETDPDREIVSKLLLQNARHLDEDGALWAQQAEAHAAEFPGDVVTIVHLANYWQRQGPEGAETSLRYARDGLSWLRRNPAKNDADKRAHHDLMKARAVAAEMLAPPAAPQENRERTARFARDWYVVAKSMDLPTERAIAMCMNGGATPWFCRGETNDLYGGAPHGAQDTDSAPADPAEPEPADGAYE